MRNKIVAKKKAVPVLLKRAITSHHMDMVRADAALCALYKKGIPRWNIIAESGSPKEVVPCRLENGRDLGARGPKTGNFHEYVNDRFAGEARDRCAAEVVDAANKPFWNAGAQMRC